MYSTKHGWDTSGTPRSAAAQGAAGHGFNTHTQHRSTFSSSQLRSHDMDTYTEQDVQVVLAFSSNLRCCVSTPNDATILSKAPRENLSSCIILKACHTQKFTTLTQRKSFSETQRKRHPATRLSKCRIMDLKNYGYSKSLLEGAPPHETLQHRSPKSCSQCGSLPLARVQEAVQCCLLNRRDGPALVPRYSALGSFVVRNAVPALFHVLAVFPVVFVLCLSLSLCTCYCRLPIRVCSCCGLCQPSFPQAVFRFFCCLYPCLGCF